MPVISDYTGSAYAHETLAVSTAVKTLTAGTFEPTDFLPVRCRGALITVHAQPLRYTLDGTSPVAATTGHVAASGAEIFIKGYHNVKNFKAIRDGGTDSQIGVTYFR